MVRTQAVTAYIDRLRNRAAQMADRAAELHDESTDTKARAAALDDLADTLERIRDRTPATVDAFEYDEKDLSLETGYTNVRWFNRRAFFC